MSESKTKTCTTCKKEKDISCFHSKRVGEAKRCDRCRTMSKMKSREYHEDKKYNCSHNKLHWHCKECNGSALCPHQQIKYKCLQCNGGKNKRRCEHNKRKVYCKVCKGGGLCEHDTIKAHCKSCSLPTYLKSLIKSRIHVTLKAYIDKSMEDYIGCTIEEYIKHLEDQFTEDMSWENHGELWEIDHIIPIQYENPTLDELIERHNHKNVQPLLKEDNRSKLNRYIA